VRDCLDDVVGTAVEGGEECRRVVERGVVVDGRTRTRVFLDSGPCRDDVVERGGGERDLAVLVVARAGSLWSSRMARGSCVDSLPRMVVRRAGRRLVGRPGGRLGHRRVVGGGGQLKHRPFGDGAGPVDVITVETSGLPDAPVAVTSSWGRIPDWYRRRDSGERLLSGWRGAGRIVLSRGR
jgi:hypothetical protein